MSQSNDSSATHVLLACRTVRSWAEHAESIPGDLLEEFSELVSKSGVAFARRWYWRQSVKTIGHLIGVGFRVATWCEGCKVEIPWYMDFQNKYKKIGLAVVGVSMDEDDWKTVRPFLKAKKVNYPVVLGDWDLASRFGITALPVTLLIDRDGRIADLHTGREGIAPSRLG